MVARIKTGKNINQAIQYNEQKVARGEANCLYGHQFIVPVDTLDTESKEKSFAKYHSLNQRTRTNSLHLSLNFHPTENLDEAKLIAIARFYMKGIGFDDQPYLVYQHNDSGHPHLHIVSTNIDMNGNRISMYNLALRASEKTRKAAEEFFELVKAGQQSALKIDSTLQKLQYGNAPTKSSIQLIVDNVLKQYAYTSLDELNAVLQQFNVKAFACSPCPVTGRHRGLLYSLLDDKGKKIGAPIFSRFLKSASPAHLEKMFVFHKHAQQHAVPAILLQLYRMGLQHPLPDKDKISSALSSKGIYLWIKRGKKDALNQQLFFIDNASKTVVSNNSLLETASEHVRNNIALLIDILLSHSYISDNTGPVIAINKNKRRKKKKRIQQFL